ncbi:MAG: choice-of-anchor Q domain-containing protein [Solirubrobacteraceae bacterium]
MRTRLLHLTFPAAAVLAVLAAAPASAAIRFASPTATLATGPCSQAKLNPKSPHPELGPCALGHAANDAAPGDEVRLLTGTYASAPTINVSNVAIKPATTAGRPHLVMGANRFVLRDGSSLTGMDVEGTGAQGLVLLTSGTVESDTLRATAGTTLAIGGAAGATARNVAAFTGANGAVSAITVQGSATLRNVTAVAPTAAHALQVLPTNSFPIVTIVNTIARGLVNDAVVSAPISNGAGTQLSGSITRSAFRPDHSAFKGGPLFAVTAPNVAADPLFVDAAGGDLREAAGSPTIDQGVTDAANGSVDAAGKPRTQGAGTDIGAFEYTPGSTPAPGDPGTPGGGPSGGGGGGAADTVAPTVSRLSLSARRFRVGRTPTATGAAARARPKTGTTIRFRLSEAATVTLKLERLRPGRRVGRRCVARTKANAKRPACQRAARAGTLARRGSAGANAVPFSGRVGARKLPPGAYRLTATARDGAGNTSKAVKATFTVVA